MEQHHLNQQRLRRSRAPDGGPTPGLGTLLTHCYCQVTAFGWIILKLNSEINTLNNKLNQVDFGTFISKHDTLSKASIAPLSGSCQLGLEAEYRDYTGQHIKPLLCNLVICSSINFIIDNDWFLANSILIMNIFICTVYRLYVNILIMLTCNHTRDKSDKHDI